VTWILVLVAVALLAAVAVEWAGRDRDRW
jgi:hypothetical protein